MNDRITWTDGRYSTEYGKVAGIHLFNIHWRGGEKPHALTTELTGLTKEQGLFAATVDAKDRAEQILEGYVEKLGGSFYFPPMAS